MSNVSDRNHVQSSFDELRVFTRSVGLLAILTALLYLRAIALGGFLYRNPNGSLNLTPVLFVLVLMATIGLVAAWRWECLGGLVAVVGAISVAALVFTTFEANRLLATFVYSSPFLVAGALCLVDWWRHRRT